MKPWGHLLPRGKHEGEGPRSKHLRLRQKRPLNVMPEGRVLGLFWH